MRAYNASWDFYKGMTPGQIEQQTRLDTGWQRPTWPLGSVGKRGFDETDLRDPLHLLQTGRIKRQREREAASRTSCASRSRPSGSIGRSRWTR